MDAGSKVEILHSPTDYFNHLQVCSRDTFSALPDAASVTGVSSQRCQHCQVCCRVQVGIAHAKQDITIASLYVGTAGRHEERFVRALASAARKPAPARPTITVLLDALRSTRPVKGMRRCLQHMFPKFHLLMGHALRQQACCNMPITTTQYGMCWMARQHAARNKCDAAWLCKESFCVSLFTHVHGRSQFWRPNVLQCRRGDEQRPLLDGALLGPGGGRRSRLPVPHAGPARPAEEVPC